MYFTLAIWRTRYVVIDRKKKTAHGPFISPEAMQALSDAIELGYCSSPEVKAPMNHMKLIRSQEYLRLVDNFDCNLSRIMHEMNPLPGWAVRWFRKQIGETQTGLANRMDCSFRTIQSFELDDRPCEGPARKLILAALEDRSALQLDCNSD